MGGAVPCEYPGLTCWCDGSGVGQEPGASGFWSCYGPPRDTRCPETLPNVGEGCNTRGVACSYVPDGCFTYPFSTVFCFDRQWEAMENPQACAN